MSENKKYYWLKLNEGFFSQTLVKKLRKIAGGDTYVIIYLKMQLLGLRSEGKFEYEGIGDTFIEELALKLDEDEENIKVTLMYLEKAGMIELLQENQFFMPSVVESTGSQTTVSERVKKCREKKMALLECNNIDNDDNENSNIDETVCNTDETQQMLHCNTEIRDNKKEKYKKEKTEEGLLEEYCFSQEMENSLKNWLCYKKEKNQCYKPTGLKGFFSKVQKQIQQYGENAVIAVIEEAISNNWQGIVWTNLSRYQYLQPFVSQPPQEDEYLKELKRCAGVGG